MGLDGMRAPGLEKPGAFFMAHSVATVLRGVAVVVFGDQLWAWFKR